MIDFYTAIYDLVEELTRSQGMSMDVVTEDLIEDLATNLDDQLNVITEERNRNDSQLYL